MVALDVVVKGVSTNWEDLDQITLVVIAMALVKLDAQIVMVLVVLIRY